MYNCFRSRRPYFVAIPAPLPLLTPRNAIALRWLHCTTPVWLVSASCKTSYKCVKYPFWRGLYFCAPLSPFIPSTRGVGILTKDSLWSPNPLISSLLSTRVYPRCVFPFQTLRTMLISSVVGVGFCWAEGRVDSWFELLGNIGINPRRVIYAHTLRSSGHCRNIKEKKVTAMKKKNEVFCGKWWP